jgi:hypothetical protein
MDCYATLAGPVQAVFTYLASPARLGDWLPEVAGLPTGPRLPDEVGAVFPLTVRTAAAEVTASGEVTAFEPPWLVGYRLSAGPRTVLLRATCAACDEGTRIHLHQAGDLPLAVDLDRLQQALATGSTASTAAVSRPPARARSRHPVPAEENPPIPRRLAP